MLNRVVCVCSFLMVLLSVAGARCVAAVRTHVLIPMSFSNRTYLDEIRAGLAKSGRPVFHFCLTAPIDVVRQRLRARGEPEGDPRWRWVHRRAAECCEAHQGAAFAIHVPTEQSSAAVIAAELAARIA